jgi:hypothetical protein
MPPGNSIPLLICRILFLGKGNVEKGSWFTIEVIEATHSKNSSVGVLDSSGRDILLANRSGIQQSGVFQLRDSLTIRKGFEKYNDNFLPMRTITPG